MTRPSNCAVPLNLMISMLAVTGLRALVRFIPPTRNVLCVVVMTLRSAMLCGPLMISNFDAGAVGVVELVIGVVRVVMTGVRLLFEVLGMAFTSELLFAL